jgi:twitching motility protein PilT
MDITKLLQSAKSLGASDLHMVVSKPPLCRIDGSIFPIEGYEDLSPEDVEQALDQVTSQAEKEVFKRTLELDFGLSIPEVGRLRFNA